MVQKDALKFIIMVLGEQCVIKDSVIQQQESSATPLDMDTMDSILEMHMVPVVDQFG